ncbi:hypothetical protein DL770_000241 [Monosporascus sp. CRB-9-2]|nr:hypothetical protein DL770_000241 [Monosporascus sp. CRB-9-2]
MGGMNPMAGGPVGGGGHMAMMPNQSLTAQAGQTDGRTRLNTYIYDFFLREGMYECARAMLASEQPINVVKDSPGHRRDENGNAMGNGLGDDPMDTDSKDDLDGKRPADLPAPDIPFNSNGSFLYEWFCLFWDIMSAQRNKPQNMNPHINHYVSYTQHQQQEVLRSLRPDGNGMFGQNPMMRGIPNGMQMNKNQPNLARTAMANNQNNPQAMQMLQQAAAKNQMQRDPSSMDGNQNRPASPGSAENAPSPSKRPRLDGNAPFNPQHGGMMPNGQRPQQGMPGQQVGNASNTSAAQQAHQMLLTNGINPTNLTPAQFQTFQNQPPQAQAKSIQTYAQNLQQHHGNQMPNKPLHNAGGPQGQGSPMMPQGHDGSTLNTFYNPGEMGGAGGMRPGPGNGQGAGGSNHALQDYQMQLMLLEQQNKKRLMMARQEQDSMGNMRADGGPAGPGGPPGSNGQPFQDTSPQAANRTGASPNPSEQQIKRGTPQLPPAGIPSPLPEGAQSRGSPNPMNFIPNNMDPNMQQHFFKGMNGMDGNMVAAAQMNGGMRPPSSHPNQPFNGMNQQQMMVARQQQQAQQQQQQQQGGPGGPPMQWQQGAPNGNAMVPQAPPGQGQGTPQQRSMPPPSAVPAAAGNAATGRTQPSSPAQSNAAPPTPQQSNKAAPKKKDTKSKAKTAAQKKSSQATGATPASETAQEPEPPTPATPMTPVNAQSFNKNGPNAGAAQQGANAPASAPQPAPAPVAAPQHADPNGISFTGMDNPGNIDFTNIDFANPLTSDNVLQDFDFDSFLHEDGDPSAFDFNPANFTMDASGEITAD